MRFFALIVSSFAALAVAQSPNPITSPTGGVIQAGATVSITWTPTTSGTITLQLRSGSANDLGAGTTIASSIANSGSYSWTPSTSITTGSDYTIEIIDDSDTSQVNYSPMFTIESSGSPSSGTSASQTSGISSFSLSLSVTSSGASSMSTASSNSTSSSSSKSSSSSSSSSSKSSSSTSSSATTAPSSNAGPHYGHTEGIIAAVVGIGAMVALA